MNNIVCVRKCDTYDVQILLDILREEYARCKGPELKQRIVLLKPNILIDEIPKRAVTTHPAFLEAAILFAKEQKAAQIWVGDSPAMHSPTFKPIRSELYDVCARTGAEWKYFAQSSTERTIGKHKIRITSVYEQADVFISLPKLKTHGLMMFTGALKNTFGLLPHLHKAKQHAAFSTQKSFAEFLWGLNEVCPPDFVWMDGIIGMEGPGPSNGTPIPMGAVLASTQPLAIDMIAAGFCGYQNEEVPLNALGVKRSPSIHSLSDITYDGPAPEQFTPANFKRIKQVGISNIMVRFLIDRLPAIRRLDRRPLFQATSCIGCQRCIQICPAQALHLDKKNHHHVIINDKLCIRCFCCHEVCPQNAIVIGRKLW